MGWIQILITAIKMLVKYGPTVWKLAKQIYDDVEGRSYADGTKMKSETSAKEFNRQAEGLIVPKTKKKMARPDLNELREDVWKYRNPGKTPKEIFDAKYRAMPKRGKTA